MTSALQVTTKVLPGHKVEVDAQEFAVGDTVEVIVLRQAEANRPPANALEIIEAYHREHPEHVPIDVEAYIREKRDSWER